MKKIGTIAKDAYSDGMSYQEPIIDNGGGGGNDYIEPTPVYYAGDPIFLPAYPSNIVTTDGFLDDGSTPVITSEPLPVSDAGVYVDPGGNAIAPLTDYQGEDNLNSDPVQTTDTTATNTTTQVHNKIMDWIKANPLLVLGIAASGYFLFFDKKRKAA